MSKETKLGTTPNSDAGRDAVHVAIVPAVASVGLMSGTPVKLNEKGEAEPCKVVDAIGVVDPFREQESRAVRKGGLFWLCLYPQTITGLRHVWEHPSFPPMEISQQSQLTKGDKAESEAWVRNYVKTHCPYYNGSDEGYLEFLRYVDQDRWIYYYGSDCHSIDDVEDRDELFTHLSVILGRRIDASYFDTFTCSC